MNTTLFWIGLASLLMFLGSIVLAWFLIIRMPADYFTNPKSRETENGQTSFRLIKFIGTNLVGLALLTAGLIMLVTPGQGLMFIFLGLAVMDFPGKHRLLLKMLENEKILGWINKIRSNAGKPPLETANISP